MDRIKCFVIVKTGEYREEVRTFGKSNEPLYVRQDSPGEPFVLADAPVGAMWDADWYHDIRWLTGPDGRSWVVRTPGGDWAIDGRASNCGSPEEYEHKCWVRHGVAPDFTVDKDGNTCSAGAGSIQMRDYHAFLRNGYLEQC